MIAIDKYAQETRNNQRMGTNVINDVFNDQDHDGDTGEDEWSSDESDTETNGGFFTI